jgi:hypothetical protein
VTTVLNFPSAVGDELSFILRYEESKKKQYGKLISY